MEEKARIKNSSLLSSTLLQLYKLARKEVDEKVIIEGQRPLEHLQFNSLFLEE
jgi:hypothetical protein